MVSNGTGWHGLSQWEWVMVLSALILLAAIWIWIARRRWDRKLTEAGGIDLTQLDELRFGASPLLLDLRSEEIYRSRKGHIRGSLNIPLDQLKARIKEVDTQDKRPVVLIEEGDEHLLEAGALLRSHGFTWIYLLKGGLKAWRRRGLHVDHFPGQES